MNPAGRLRFRSLAAVLVVAVAATGFAASVAAAQPPDDARVLLRDGRVDEAIRLLESRLEARPGDPDLEATLSLAMLAKARELTDQESDAVVVGSLLNDARKRAEAAIEAAPDHFEGHRALGLVLQFQSEFADSEAALRRALEIRPDDAATWYDLGETLRFDERFDEAIAAFEKAAGDRALAYEATRRVGLCRQMQERDDLAADAYLRALRLAPDALEAWDDLWNLYAARSRFDEAAAVYRKLADELPENAYARLLLGSVLAYAGRDEAALAPLREAARLSNDPGIRSGALYQIALVERALGREEEAVASLQASLEAAPDFEEPATLLRALALAEAESERYEGAIAKLELLASVRERDAATFADLGRVLRASGKAERALEAFRKARALDPANPQVLNDLAEVLDQALDRKDEAMLLYLEALAEGSNLDATENLARLYLHFGLAEEADRLAEEGIALDATRIGLWRVRAEAKRILDAAR